MGFPALALADLLDGDLQWLLIRLGRIVLILLVAVILSVIVRRTARTLAARLAARQEARRADGQKAYDRRFDSLREKLVDALPAPDSAERVAQRARTLGVILGSVGSIVIYATAIMLCLGELQINLAPILASAGVAGVALGFGAQSLVRDFLTGIFIIVEDQYGVGDTVDLGEATGTVEEVTLRITRVRGLDGTLWHVPNGEIRRSGNMSQYWARVILDIPVAYDSDLVSASTLIKQTADDVWHDSEGRAILEEPQVWGLEEFGPDAIAIRLVVKTLPGSQWSVARALRARVKEALDRGGFEIPFPQRTVWLRESSAPPHTTLDETDDA